jgi:hypothetical protein
MRATILLATALLLGSFASVVAGDDNHDASHDAIKLSSAQVEAEHFALTEAQGGVLEQHISVLRRAIRHCRSQRTGHADIHQATHLGRAGQI